MGIPYTKYSLPLVFTGLDYQFIGHASAVRDGRTVRASAAVSAMEKMLQSSSLHDKCHANHTDMINTCKFAGYQLPKGVELGHQCSDCGACVTAKCKYTSKENNVMHRRLIKDK